MNKTALYGILLALLLPLVAYFIVKQKSERDVKMPRHYLPDSIVTVTKKGKRMEDTVWHKVKNLTLINQEGKTVNFDSLKGKIIIADFFFTRCPTICPAMTMNMKRMAESIHNGKRVGDKTNKLVHFVSLSVDSERDSVPQLKKWADRFQVNPETWWLLTGDKKEIYDFALNEVKLGLIDGEGVDTNFVHSDKFVLIDSNRH
ncbi:MAG TPA: SCO family protein, partial [Chitinophagaceae bacterium]|nr:SCO family protein [Chitinophagaceae bacterium]